jgi:hypothetical protein
MDMPWPNTEKRGVCPKVAPKRYFSAGHGGIDYITRLLIDSLDGTFPLNPGTMPTLFRELAEIDATH